MFCPECDTIMEEVGTIPGLDPAENEVTDLFECPRCHCVDERQRSEIRKKFELPDVA
jgi:uncharacterized C2H2 Zn-finger protein